MDFLLLLILVVKAHDAIPVAVLKGSQLE